MEEVIVHPRPVCSARGEVHGCRTRSGWLHAAVALCMLVGVVRSATAQVPSEGLAAEGEHRWQDALRVYEPIAREHPERADLWVRIADIHSALGNTDASIQALFAAAKGGKGDPELYARVSRACAEANRPKPALAAMQAALALRPDDRAYLKAAGELASWNGDYATARHAYERLLTVDPRDAVAWLALARVDTWGGEVDAAARAYRVYTSLAPADLDGWTEWARAESWRGNDAAALRVLAQTRRLFGESSRYRQTLAFVLTRAARPVHAGAVLKPLLSADPADYDLRLLDALTALQRGDAGGAWRRRDALERVAPERRETDGLARQIRAAFASAVQPAVRAYGDSDGLRTYRLPVAASVNMTPWLAAQGGFERTTIVARLGSGLERADGARSADVKRGWVGTEIRLRPEFVVRGRVGRESAMGRHQWTYDAGAAVRIGDAWRVAFDRERTLMTISPRTVSLGLEREADRVRLAWSPTVWFVLDVDSSIERISDDNDRRSVRVAPRVAVVRNEWMNLDLGGSVFVLEATRDLDDGYYDPKRYEFYGVTLLPYLKFSEDVGLSLFVEAGVQRDDRRLTFEPGGSATTELTIGIYRSWMLKLDAAITTNSRLDSGAYRGYGAGARLVRRF
jgi:tetratricopeptide (TPR) repeat protein